MGAFVAERVRQSRPTTDLRRRHATGRFCIAVRRTDCDRRSAPAVRRNANRAHRRSDGTVHDAAVLVDYVRVQF